MMKHFLFICSLVMMGSYSLAQNPLVTHMFTADPTARCFNEKLYVYPSTDIVPPEGVNMPQFCMPGYHIFSLENGATWKDYGWVLKENEVPWGEKNTYAMWAPDCIEKDGKYYFFFPAKAKNDKAFRRIGVGISNSPTGPFMWQKQFLDDVQGIDPGLMVDDDNQAYLFFGGGQNLFVAPLSDDMLSVKQHPIRVEGLPAGYKEGSFPFKKDGLYYLTFAHVFAEEGYTIGYATSESPMGPYVYRGKIMDNIDNGTNHHSIVKYQGKYILFYHFWHISGFNKLRSMCADYMEFKPDGTIRKVKPTLRGIGTPTMGDTIQVDRYNEISKAQTAFLDSSEPVGWMICEAKTGAFVRFNRVNFGKNGEAKQMKARMASGQRTGKIIVKIDALNGPTLAEFPIKYTGGWDHWITQETALLRQVEGVHDLFIQFWAEPGNTKTANLNWMMLE